MSQDRMRVLIQGINKETKINSQSPVSCTRLVKLDPAVESSRISAGESSQLTFLKVLNIKEYLVSKRYLKCIIRGFTILNLWK